MKLQPDDPRLTAYLLGELPANQVAALQRAVAADPALQVALQDLTDLHRTLAATLVAAPGALTPTQRETIRAAARQAPAAVAPCPAHVWRPRQFLALAAAALVMLAAGIWMFATYSANPGPAQQGPVAQVPVPVPADSRPSPADPPARPLPAPGPAQAGNPPPRALVAAADQPVLDLPVQAGQASLGWIREALRNQHRLPPHRDVRIEEILNAFTLRPNGPTVVARQPANQWHPDDRGFGTTTHAATLATETLPCPWHPSASLVLISFRANPHSDCDLKAVFRCNPATVLRYRLLGFAHADSPATASLPTLLSAKSSILLAIQIEPATAADTATADADAAALGTIEWSVDGHPAAPLTLARHLDAEPSDDARFAALLCTFALWLTGEAAEVIDADLLAALTRESAATPTLAAERADLIRLITEALEL